jgi:hypothetical protein
LVLQAIIAQHGLFSERARDIFSFAHLTFQEYFASRYIVEDSTGEMVPRLLDHYADHRYREVFLLTAAQLPDGQRFFDLFLNWLAADAQERPTVTAVLRHAERKSATTTGDGTSAAAARCTYLFLALAFDGKFYHEPDLAHAHAIAHALAHGRVLGLDLDLVLARSHYDELALAITERDYDYLNDLFSALDRARNGARSLARALARDPYTHLARDIALVYARSMLLLGFMTDGKPAKQSSFAAGKELLETAAAQSRALTDSTTAEKLADLSNRVKSVATGSNPGDERMSAELDAILEACDLRFSTLDEEDWESCSRYLKGNRLLLECLDQAIVPDREAIKERLLLLPLED